MRFLVALGGLAFNIGNVGGAGLGLNVIFGVDVKIGAAIGGVIGIILFLIKVSIFYYGQSNSSAWCTYDHPNCFRSN